MNEDINILRLMMLGCLIGGIMLSLVIAFFLGLAMIISAIWLPHLGRTVAWYALVDTITLGICSVASFLLAE